MTTKTSEKQQGFEGLENGKGIKDIGDVEKNATTRPSAFLPQGGLMVGRDWKLYCCDSLNITVARRQKSKDGTGENWINAAYFSTLAGALHFLVEQQVKDSQLKDLKKVVDAVAQLKKDITEALKAV